MKFVLDTNIYLHYKLFTEGDWKTLLGSEDLTLVVPPTVIKELDEKKYTAPNTRLKRKAQEIISKFKEISEGKSVPNGIQIVFPDSSIEDVDWGGIGLNSSNADDRIIAATLALKEKSAGDAVLIVTADFGLELKAKNHNIKCVSPPEDWKIETKDSRDKEIAELQVKLQKYQNALPDVQLLLSTGDNSVPVLKISKDVLLEGILTDEDIEAKLEQEHKEVKPIGTVNTINQGFISKEQIRMYNEEVREYIKKYRKYLNDVKEIQESCLTIELSPVLINGGNSPAEDIDIFFEYPNDWLNSPNDIELLEEAYLLEIPEKPARPNPPKSDIASVASSIASVASSFQFPSSSGLMPVPILPQINRKHVNQTGPEINKSEMSVHYWLNNLKHGMEWHPKPVYVLYSSVNAINTFQIKYSIRIGNHPKVKEGDLIVVIGDKK